MYVRHTIVSGSLPFCLQLSNLVSSSPLSLQLSKQFAHAQKRGHHPHKPHPQSTKIGENGEGNLLGAIRGISNAEPSRGGRFSHSKGIRLRRTPIGGFFCPVTFELLLNPHKRPVAAIISPKRPFAGCNVTGSRIPCVRNHSYPQCRINFTGAE